MWETDGCTDEWTVYWFTLQTLTDQKCKNDHKPSGNPFPGEIRNGVEVVCVCDISLESLYPPLLENCHKTFVCFSLFRVGPLERWTGAIKVGASSGRESGPSVSGGSVSR